MPEQEIDPFDETTDEPTPLPDVSFLSMRPAPPAFLWALGYAVLSGVLTFWALWDPAFRARLIIRGDTLFSPDAPLRLFSSMLLHSGLDHFLANMVLLVPFGGFTAAYYGVWAFPVICVTLGVATHFLTILTYPPYLGLVGSSGLLYVLFGFWLVLYAFVESHLPWTRRIFRLAGFSLMMLIPHSYSPKTSYRAHYIGLGLGILAALVFYALNRTKLKERNLKARLLVKNHGRRGLSRRLS